jgi:UDP-2,3-diacylglucosamine pyrophosphatase LpxH
MPATQEAEIGRLRFKATPGKSGKPYLKSKLRAKDSWCQWLTPVVLATRKAEIGKIMVQGHVHKKDPHLQNNHSKNKNGLEVWLQG